MTGTEPAPQVWHDLLDAAWRHNDGSLGTGFKFYENFTRDGRNACVRIGGDASGFRLATPLYAEHEEYGEYRLLKWHGAPVETGGFLLGEPEA